MRLLVHTQRLKPPHHPTQSGFSLAECLMAVGITATALLGVIGMLAGAMSSARDARLLTTSGVLLRQLSGEARELTRENQTPPADVIVLFDSAMQVLSHSHRDPSVGAIYESGTDEPAAATFARLRREPDQDNPWVDRVLITVEAPAAAPAGQRKVLHYATLASN